MGIRNFLELLILIELNLFFFLQVDVLDISKLLLMSNLKSFLHFAYLALTVLQLDPDGLDFDVFDLDLVVKLV